MGTLTMSGKERRRLEILSQVRDQKLSVSKASELMKLSVRQARRVWKRFKTDGDAALVHRLRGRVSNHARPADLKQRVLARYRQRYTDFGPTLAAEKLTEEGHAVGRQTLWRWLLAEGLWARRRRVKAHRSRRERRACLGQMLQMDGSHHDWFEGRGPWCVLMVMVDDATGRTFAQFVESETTVAAFDLFGGYVRKYGLPLSLYVDRDSIYRCDRQATVEEELQGSGPLTQFARAMKALEVELILAHSPQAKGRVERMNGTLQDRLVKELRLAGISDIASANVFLQKSFLPALNRRFAVKAKSDADVHRAVGRGVKLAEILCFEQKRIVSNDWCVSWRKRIFQLDRRHEAMGLARRAVIVREKLDGTIQLLSQGHKLHWRELRERPRKQTPLRQPKNNTPWKPSAAHPWRSPACPPRSGSAAKAAAPARGGQAERKKAQ
jgi:molybdenum-dependent DNA-binding transcriptional regulator ModE